MKFIDRRRELDTLGHFYRRTSAGLLVLYGRRRVGKTSLLSHWVETAHLGDNILFWTATTYSSAIQLRDFSHVLIRFDRRFSTDIPIDLSLPTWTAAFEYLASLAAQYTESTPLVVIIDEFTYLIQSDPAIVSALQKVWDHKLSKLAGLRLILSGSLVGVMERDVLSAKSPLYGRATTLMKLHQLPYGALVEIFPDWSPAERVAVYGVCGGVPAYLNLFQQAQNFTDGLTNDCLSPSSIMLSDAALLINERLSEPQTYLSILGTLAGGFHTWSDIARMSGVSEGNLGYYLQTLQALEMVERRDPVLSPRSNRRGHYHINDSFLRFHFRFIVPYRTSIERGDMMRVVKVLSEELRAFIGTYVYEELCREWTLTEADAGHLGFLPEDIGAFWGRYRGSGVQLDVVAASRREKRLFIGEAKWGEEPLPRNILTDLVKRSRHMPQVAEGWQTEYALFSRGGFTDATRQAAKEVGARLVDLPQMERALVRASRGEPQ